MKFTEQPVGDPATPPPRLCQRDRILRVTHQDVISNQVVSSGGECDVHELEYAGDLSSLEMVFYIVLRKYNPQESNRVN